MLRPLELLLQVLLPLELLPPELLPLELQPPVLPPLELLLPVLPPRVLLLRRSDPGGAPAGAGEVAEASGYAPYRPSSPGVALPNSPSCEFRWAGN